MGSKTLNCLKLLTRAGRQPDSLSRTAFFASPAVVHDCTKEKRKPKKCSSNRILTRHAKCCLAVTLCCLRLAKELEAPPQTRHLLDPMLKFLSTVTDVKIRLSRLPRACLHQTLGNLQPGGQACHTQSSRQALSCQIETRCWTDHLLSTWQSCTSLLLSPSFSPGNLSPCGLARHKNYIPDHLRRSKMM